MMNFNLRNFENNFEHYGRSKGVFLLWLTVRATIYCIPLPGRIGDIWRTAILRFFGSTIGDRLLIRRSAKVHFPWKFSCGSDVWIGENVDIYNLEEIMIGSNVCISQYVYLCTGSHDYKSVNFKFRNRAIKIEDGSWIGCRALLLPGCVVKERTFVPAGSTFK